MTPPNELMAAINLYNEEQYEECVTHINNVLRDDTPGYGRVRFYSLLAWCSDDWFEAENMRIHTENLHAQWCISNPVGNYPRADIVRQKQEHSAVDSAHGCNHSGLWSNLDT